MRDWTLQARDALATGQSPQIQVRGHSMTSRIEDGDFVTLAPCAQSDLAVGDAVLVTVSGRRHPITVLHLIREVNDGKFLIGNALGRIDGWVEFSAIHGKAADVVQSF